MKKTLFLLAISSLGFAQTKETKTEETKESRVIKVYTPTDTGVSKSDNSYKWAVKTDLLSYITGEFPIIGEYRVMKKLSVEASLGLTYSYLENSGILEDESEYPPNGTTFETTAAMGSSVRAAVKFFPSSDYDAIEGWYFGVQFFNKVNKRDYGSSYGSYDTYDLDGKQDVRTKTGASLLIGRQIFSDSNIIFDTYIGIGFANVKREQYYGESYDVNNNMVYEVRKFDTQQSKPNFQFGFRIGFGN